MNRLGDTTSGNRIVITVIGPDRVGIIAAVSTVLAEKGVNILDINQTIMQEFFVMVLVADIGCAKLVVFANVPEDNPFMAGSFHGIGEPDCVINTGVSGSECHLVLSMFPWLRHQLSVIVLRKYWRRWVSNAAELPVQLPPWPKLLPQL